MSDVLKLLVWTLFVILIFWYVSRLQQWSLLSGFGGIV